ncbi:hypothetical protein [Ensifer adhaerens]|uniref:hypothetical protein n=1 Tax=Ensifer adhaerens TaxID=106592 RepID=UPI00098EA0FF|nr:hypothetical protein [Ensifer adhaerens]
MADFVAVIRRTVGGLSENTPEMRDRVYEKARAAVRRQLENMNPRPSDDMINRQLAKLENAIAEVDSEHAEALPALDEPEVAEAETVEPVASDAAVDEPVPETETETETEAEPEPEAERAPVVESEPVAESEPVHAVEQPAPEDEGVAETYHHAEAYEEPAHAVEPHGEPAEEAPAEPVEYEPAVEPAETVAQPLDETPVVAQPHEDAPAYEAPEYSEPVAETQDTSEPTWEEAPAASAEQKPELSEWDLPEWETVGPTSTVAPVTEHLSDERAAEAHEPDNAPELLGLHPVDEPEQQAPQATPNAEPARGWSFDDNDPFAPIEERRAEKTSEPEISDWSWPVEKPVQANATPATQDQQERTGTAWDHIDDLLGFEDAANAAAAGAGAAAAAREPERSVEAVAATVPRPASYRATPKPSRFSVKRLSIAAVALLVLGGGGFAYWQNREAGNAWISSVVASITSAVSSIGGAPAEQATPPQPAGETATQEPAAHDDTAVPDNASTKFTQRLMADGSETDDGPANATGESAAQEGKSVAPQTEAGKPVETAAGQGGTAGQAGTPAEGQPAGQPNQTEVALASGEKMFLYEERLGQSSPTAVPGTVAWSVKQESPGGDAKPEPAIQAQITIPDRGLTALMTIKRNADPSLPASHVIEFVFSLPQNFEGGAIDSVQRVSMKRTEQDRGDALIAVPAKITDDFHMIALNDATDAISNNTELLRSRSWIDIPLTYRNGRRALLTLEKGPSGTDAFNQAMRAWTATGTAAQSNSQ